MGATRFLKAMAFVALFNGALFLCVREEAIASEKEEEAKKYTEQLRTSKDAKVRIKALTGLGELAQVKKSFITDASAAAIDFHFPNSSFRTASRSRR